MATKWRYTVPWPPTPANPPSNVSAVTGIRVTPTNPWTLFLIGDDSSCFRYPGFKVGAVMYRHMPAASTPSIWVPPAPVPPPPSAIMPNRWARPPPSTTLHNRPLLELRSVGKNRAPLQKSLLTAAYWPGSVLPCTNSITRYSTTTKLMN